MGLVRSTEDIVRWKSAFLVLSIDRIQPLLALAGAPSGIVQSPSALRDEARTFLFEVGRLSMVDDVEHQESNVERIVRALLVRVRGTYGTRTANELQEWINRHFLREGERARWWIWSLLLPSLAGVSAGRPKAKSRLPESARAQFEEIVKAHYNADAQRLEEEQLQRARAVPLSPLESQLVELEVSRPTDLPEIDVVEEMEELIRCERARSTWKELEQVLARENIKLVVQWARLEGEHDGMPADIIAPP